MAQTSRVTRRTHFVLLAIGVFLLFAAALKIQGLASNYIPEHSLLASPHVQVLAIDIEITLGFWLLSGWARRQAWGVAVVFFTVMITLAGYSAWSGQRSCGCFGRIEVNPWLTFAFNVVVLAALTLCRPNPTPNLNVRRPAWFVGVLRTGVGAAALLVLVGGVFLLAFDNPADALARLRGESLTVEPSVSQVGDGTIGEARTFTVHVRNHIDRPIRVVGGTTNCACIATNDLPIVVPPHEAQPMEVQVKFQDGTGRFQHRFVLYTDDEQQKVIVARFSGRVIEASLP